MAWVQKALVRTRHARQVATGLWPQKQRPCHGVAPLALAPAPSRSAARPARPPLGPAPPRPARHQPSAHLHRRPPQGAQQERAPGPQVTWQEVGKALGGLVLSWSRLWFGKGQLRVRWGALQDHSPPGLIRESG